MKIITNIKQMQSWASAARKKGKTIGFVPTMGCLHDGHLSLIRKARHDNDYVVISIFVNPTQFRPKEDLRRYPRNFTQDKKLAQSSGVDVIFYPKAHAMYPDGYKSFISVGELGDVLCGASRPGHFRGVATIVLKLFNIVLPNIAYFGQKDAQQAVIIKQMVKDLTLPLKIKTLPIVREKDGLAMSSRNKYLSREERQEAIILYKSLQAAVGMIKLNNKAPREITKFMRKMIRSRSSARIDYVKIVDADTLENVKKFRGCVLICLAVFFGKTRLIDNVIVRV